jgi:guanylate kinase
VFILPPSYAELRKRLHTRNTDQEVEIARRLENAQGEIEQLLKYQYAIVNDSVEGAMERLRAIVAAERLRTTRFIPGILQEYRRNCERTEKNTKQEEESLCR